MQNFPFKHSETGETLWYSRSVAVVGILSVCDEDKDKVFVMAVKRGKNSGLDESNKWSLPCGYLDFNETCEEALVREFFEETGIKTDKNKWVLKKVDSNPNSNRQNVSLIYVYQLEYYDRFGLEKEGLYSLEDERITRLNKPEEEGDEIDEVKWIDITNWSDDANYSELYNHEWAFEHDELIKMWA